MVPLLFSLELSTAFLETDFFSFERTKSQIDEKHQERFRLYFADSCLSRVNFSSRECPFCQSGQGYFALEEIMRKEGFLRKTSDVNLSGHCLGITLLFIKYLLAHPPKQGDSCQEILQAFQNISHLKEKSHILQVHQPRYFAYREECKDSLTDPQAAKKIFSLLIENPVENYFCIPESELEKAKFHRVAFYLLLQKFAGQIILIGYSDEKTDSAHCFAILALEKKVLVFDANDGLFEFADFETASYLHEKLLVGKRLTFFVTWNLI